MRDRSHRNGLVDEELAAAARYHWDRVPAAPTAPGQAACAGEAYRSLGWAQDELLWLGGLPESLLRQTYAGPRATAVTGRWSTRVDQADVRYAEPRDAGADPRWSRVPASPAEKRTAVADVRCKARVGFDGEPTGVLAELEAGAGARHARRLDAFRAMAATAVPGRTSGAATTGRPGRVPPRPRYRPAGGELGPRPHDPGRVGETTADNSSQLR